MAPGNPLQARFSHVGIHVHSLDAMAAFYTSFLGFVETDRGKLGAMELVFLSRDPREHHQIVLVTGRPAEARFTTVNQISLRVADTGALRWAHANAAASGASDVQSVTHGNALSVYLRDPEGNRIELFIDTPWHCTQPVREPFDLSGPDEELWRRAETFARSRPGFRPASEWREALQAQIAAQ